MTRRPRERRTGESRSGGAQNGNKNLTGKHNDLSLFGTLMSPSPEEADLDPALNYQPLPEPAASAKAIAESPEGDHLYQDIKSMEYEALQQPDPDDVLVQTSITEEIPGDMEALLPVPVPGAPI